jgi:hypothetical protein
MSFAGTRRRTDEASPGGITAPSTCPATARPVPGAQFLGAYEVMGPWTNEKGEPWTGVSNGDPGRTSSEPAPLHPDQRLKTSRLFVIHPKQCRSASARGLMLPDSAVEFPLSESATVRPRQPSPDASAFMRSKSNAEPQIGCAHTTSSPGQLRIQIRASQLRLRRRSD